MIDTDVFAKLNIGKSIQKARVDIKNKGREDNNLLVINRGENVFQLTEPLWYCDEQGMGKVIIDESGTLSFEVHCVGNGMLHFSLRGIDKRENGTPIPYWVVYTSFKINGLELLTHVVTAWHNKPFVYEKKVSNCDSFQIEIAWHSLYNICTPYTILNDKISLIQCLENFDNGARKIYITDNDGRYMWKEININGFSLSRNKIGNYVVKTSTSNPILCLENDTVERLYEEIGNAFKKYPDESVLPVLNREGVVIGEVRRHGEERREIDWKKFVLERIDLPYRKIILTSMGNKYLCDFIRLYKTNTNVSVLNSEILKSSIESIKDENDCKIICGPNKINLGENVITIFELYDRMEKKLHKKKQKEMLSKYDGFNGIFPGEGNEVEFIRIESRKEQFFKSFYNGSLIVIDDLYDVNEIVSMCVYLKSHHEEHTRLYLKYHSIAQFEKMLEIIDWSEVLKWPNIIFVFSNLDLISWYERLYSANVDALKKYEFCWHDDFPNFDKLVDNKINEGYLDNQFCYLKYFNIHDEGDDNQLFLQLDSEKPILLKNYNKCNELLYISSNLRTSERYGSDNHLYLWYTSEIEFVPLLLNRKFVSLICNGKIVFLFGKEKDDYYPIAHNSLEQSPTYIHIDELKTIISLELWSHDAGNTFFQSLLDNHRSLIVPTYGPRFFNAIYNNFLKGRKVSQVIHEYGREKDKWANRWIDELFQKKFFEERFPNQRFIDEKTFFSKIIMILGDKIATAEEWFKTLFLAYAYTYGYEYNQRLAPVCVHSMHSLKNDVFETNLSVEDVDELEYLYKTFEYRKVLLLVRSPINTLGHIIRTAVGRLVYRGESEWISNSQLLYSLEVRFAMDDDRLHLWRAIRFEDLKLYPKETLRALCEFCFIPWDEELLYTTVNGNKLGAFHGSVGFDTAPVYRRHDEKFGAFDRFRAELLGPQFDEWGYIYHHYDSVVYNREAILKMMELPFKWEREVNQNNIIKAFHLTLRKLVMEKFDEYGRIKNKNILKCVKWLKPKVDNKRLYE